MINFSSTVNHNIKVCMDVKHDVEMVGACYCYI